MNYVTAIKYLCQGNVVVRNSMRPGYINDYSDVWIEINQTQSQVNSNSTRLALRKTNEDPSDYSPSFEDMTATDWALVIPNGTYYTTTITLNELYTS